MRLRLSLLCLLVILLRADTPSPGKDLARAIRENSFDRDECYRVRDLTIQKEDVRIYLTDGYLIFSKPVAGRRIAAVFSAEVDGGDARGHAAAARSRRAAVAGRLHRVAQPGRAYQAAMFLFTGDDYEQLKAQMAEQSRQQESARDGAACWTSNGRPCCATSGASYQTRLTLDLIGGPAWKPGSSRR